MGFLVELSAAIMVIAAGSVISLGILFILIAGFALLWSAEKISVSIFVALPVTVAVMLTLAAVIVATITSSR